MKSKTLLDYNHRIAEERVSSKMELSTDQPVDHPEARRESGANDEANLNVLEVAPRCPR
jgi:hypothetical protein